MVVFLAHISGIPNHTPIKKAFPVQSSTTTAMVIIILVGTVDTGDLERYFAHRLSSPDGNPHSDARELMVLPNS